MYIGIMYEEYIITCKICETFKQRGRYQMYAYMFDRT